MKLTKTVFAFLCYLIGFSSILYYADFFMGFVVPKAINTGSPTSFLGALSIDVGLICLFGLQHSIMARKHFKKWFEAHSSPSLTRSFYILLSSVALGVLVLFWQPIPLVIYDFTGTTIGSVLLVLYYVGWAIGLLSTFEIDHLKLFGIQQAMFPNKEKQHILKMPFFYKVVRHPIYLGWVLIHWMTPQLTIGHLLLALGMTIYIYIALRYEERDLIGEFGQAYLDYQKVTPQINPLLRPIKKNKKVMVAVKVLGAFVVVVLLVSGFKFFQWVSHEMALMNSDNPIVWESEIERLSQQNKEVKNDSIDALFVGSSSFRFWDSMPSDLAPLRIINNGFGGAKLPDVIYYKDELIYQYHPDTIVFFLGSNDISGNENDKSPQELYDAYEELCIDIHQKLPDCHIYILPITPTLARWEVWPEIEKANNLIKQHSQNADWVTYIDLQNAFLDDNDTPIWRYYKWDGTHLSHKGYNIWTKALKSLLIKKNNGVASISKPKQ